MGLENYGDDELIEALANRGIDVRHIKEYSMTELNNEITRRRMEAERADLIQEALQDGIEAEIKRSRRIKNECR